MAHSDTNTKLRIIKREVYSMLQRDEELIEILLEELTKQGSESSTIVESFRQNKSGALGSELLGALKQVVDLESLIVRRCWDLMRQDWFDRCVRNVDV